MIPWQTIDRAMVPGKETELIFRRRGGEFSIQVAGTELMNSRAHGSEEALARLCLEKIHQKENQRILIGGLGMGFTLAAALEHSPMDASCVVAELVPEIISWNNEHLGHLAGNPMEDPRAEAMVVDVAEEIRRKQGAWHAILLDVDNGPTGLTQRSNNRLYNKAGLKAAFRALVPGGVFGVWSAGDDPDFTRSLKKCGFQARTFSVPARRSGKGGRHTIWVAEKPV